MNNPTRICTLRDIEIHVAALGEVCAYRCGSDGELVGEPLREDASAGTFRYYHCTNCGAHMPGDKEFTARQHLGKMHEAIFTFPEI